MFLLLENNRTPYIEPKGHYTFHIAYRLSILFLLFLYVWQMVFLSLAYGYLVKKKGDISAAPLLMLNVHMIVMTSYTPQYSVALRPKFSRKLVKSMCMSRTCFNHATTHIYVDGTASIVCPTMMNMMDSPK
jgi:hypothetical protein